MPLEDLPIVCPKCDTRCIEDPMDEFWFGLCLSCGRLLRRVILFGGRCTFLAIPPRIRT